MADAVVASAPGKVVLSGEYAVLDGAPAIAMAVDRRVRVRLAPADGEVGTVTASGFDAEPGRFRMRAGVPQWLDGAERFSLLRVLLELIQPEQAVDLHIDSREFRDPASGLKYGLGSSAAVAAAVCAGLCGPEKACAVASSAHRAWQEGRGSGIDVATCSQGGLLHYRQADARRRPIDWPPGLYFRVLFSGVSSDTGSRLERLADVAGRPTRNALSRAAADMATAWCDGSAAGVLSRYPAYLDALRSFDDDHELGIFAAGHAELADAAAAAGLFYKPSGAGGGDIGILFADNAGVLDAFVAAHELHVLDCRLDGRGAIQEKQAAHER